MEEDFSPAEKSDFKKREFTRIFEGIDDEIALIIAGVKLNFTLCKINEENLKITVDYIEDTKKLITLLKTRVGLLREATS
jgi:molybdenum cofactor biosynthesis enzyme MoaA